MEDKNDNMMPLTDFSNVMPLLKKAWEFQSKGHGTAFIDLSGHVACISIKLFVHGWRSGIDGDIDIEIRLCETEENKWARFDVNNVNRAIESIDELIDNTPSLEEARANQHAAELERQKKQYEKLKAKFEPPVSVS